MQHRLGVTGLAARVELQGIRAYVEHIVTKDRCKIEPVLDIGSDCAEPADSVFMTPPCLHIVGVVGVMSLQEQVGQRRVENVLEDRSTVGLLVMKGRLDSLP